MSLEVLTPEVAAKEAAGPLYTATSPGEFSAEKHVPKVSIADGTVTIEVPHGGLYTGLSQIAQESREDLQASAL